MAVPGEAEGPVGLTLGREAGVHEQLAVARELGYERRAPPADEHVAVGQDLCVALGGSGDPIGGDILAQQCGFHLVFGETYNDRAGLIIEVGMSAVVEDGDGAVLLTAGIVLEGGPGSLPHLEVALLATKPPQDIARFAVDLVDGPGVAGTDEQVVVVVDIYGVDVEVVVAEARIVRREAGVGLLDTDVIEASPLEDDLLGLDIHLLDYPFPHRAIFWSTNRGQVRSPRSVGHQERGVLRGDEKLVQVPRVAVACAHPAYLAVGVVEDHVLTFAVA